MMTNHDDALKVTDDARRYWVWETGLYGKQGWETKEKKAAYFHEFKDYGSTRKTATRKHITTSCITGFRRALTRGATHRQRTEKPA